MTLRQHTMVYFGTLALVTIWSAGMSYTAYVHDLPYVALTMGIGTAVDLLVFAFLARLYWEERRYLRRRSTAANPADTSKS